MTLFHCSIHNITFGAEPMELHLVECPMCAFIKIKQLETELKEALSHRDALLRAIEIKQTVHPK